VLRPRLNTQDKRGSKGKRHHSTRTTRSGIRTNADVLGDWCIGCLH